MRGKAHRRGQGLKRAGEVELPRVEGLLQGGEEPPAEEPRSHADRQEEARTTGDPPRAVRREAATGDDAMEMRVMHQGLSPGVQHGEKPDRGAEMPRVRGDRAQGVRGRAEEDAVDDRFVLQGDLGDRLGHGEDDVEVFTGEEVGGAVLDPRGAGQRLAAGAMPIAAANGELTISCLMESARFWGVRG